jgi:hypothetical protein
MSDGDQFNKTVKNYFKSLKSETLNDKEIINFLTSSYRAVNSFTDYFLLKSAFDDFIKSIFDDNLILVADQIEHDCYSDRRKAFFLLIENRLDGLTNHIEVLSVLKELEISFNIKNNAQILSEEHEVLLNRLAELYIDKFTDFYQLLEVADTVYAKKCFNKFDEKLVLLLKHGLEHFNQEQCINFIDTNWRNNYRVFEAIVIKIIVSTLNKNTILDLMTKFSHNSSIKRIGTRKIISLGL